MNYQFSSMGWQSLSACCKLLADLSKLDLANERESQQRVVPGLLLVGVELKDSHPLLQNGSVLVMELWKKTPTLLEGLLGLTRGLHQERVFVWVFERGR